MIHLDFSHLVYTGVVTFLINLKLFEAVYFGTWCFFQKPNKCSFLFSFQNSMKHS